MKINSAIILFIFLTSCKINKIRQPVWYFWPMKVPFASSISTVSKQLNLDTTEYVIPRTANYLKEYTLKRSNLDKLNFYNNYADSIKLAFFNNKLFLVSIFASGNQKTEYLKHAIRGETKSDALIISSDLEFRNDRSLDTTSFFIESKLTFEYEQYRGLDKLSTDKHVVYSYEEDIVNVRAKLTIFHSRMLRDMPRKKIH